ncbi:MAG: integrase [Verrucomicrobiota bacterium]|jgi:integrase
MKKTNSQAGKFSKVLDGHEQPIRGLYLRNGRYYGRIARERADTVGKTCRREALEVEPGVPARTQAEAVKALKRLQGQRDDEQGALSIGRVPGFSDYADEYLENLKAGVGTKQPGTISKETGTLKLWKDHLGNIRLDKIRPAHIAAFAKKRLLAKMSKRTVELDIIALRNVLKRARDVDQHLPLIPIPPGLNRELHSIPPKRPLFAQSHLDRLCAAAFETKKNEAGADVPLTKNAREFVDYVRLLAYSGARRNEGLALKWSDVDFEREQLTIGSTVDTKNQQARVVDFNDKLEAHLKEMLERRPPDTEWLFASPQRGDTDRPAKSFRESLEMARERAGLPGVAFHDLRHYFVSYCVMSGIDFMTIARWVGHQDGGILIGKVYGHLADDHSKTQARRLHFGPVVLERAANEL